MSGQGSVLSAANVARASSSVSKGLSAPRLSPSSSTATPTTARWTDYSILSATSYVKAKTDDDAIHLCNELRRAFIQGGLDHDRERTGKRTLAALATFEEALNADTAAHPFASVAPIELAGPIASLLTFVDEDADGFAAEVRERAESALLLLVQRATSPREIHHAMLVRMARAGKRIGEGNASSAEHVDKSCALHEMSVLIRLQAKALPRIRTKRMNSFVRALAVATRNALTRLLNEEHPPGHRIPRVTEATLLGAIAELIHTIVELEPHDADVLEILRDYLLHTLAQLASSPPLAAILAENYFRAQNPRFAQRLFTQDPGMRRADAEAWNTVKVSARELKLGSQGLFSLASRHDMPPPGPPRFIGLSVQEGASSAGQSLALPDPRARTSPPLSSQGAFVLLAHLLADQEEQEGLIGGWYAIRCTLPHVIAALSGAGGQAVDEALFWLLWSFDHGLNAIETRTEEVDEATLYPIVELLSALASLSPDDDIRFLSFRLLSILVCKVLADRDDLQLVLIADLLDGAPYPFLRAATLGLLRELIIERLSSSEKPSLFRSPVLLVELGKHILQASPRHLASISVDDFVNEAHLQANAERLGLVYAVMLADQQNKITLRSTDRLHAVEKDLIKPLRAALARWQSRNDLDETFTNALGVLCLQLDLAVKAIEQFNQ